MISRAQRTAAAPLFQAVYETTPKVGKARRAREMMDAISDDETLMPPPNKRIRTAENNRSSKEDELVDFPKFDSDELARQFFADLELDASVLDLSRFQSTTPMTPTESIYYASQEHPHRSPLAPLRQEFAAGWTEPSCSRKRKFNHAFEIYEDPADVEITWSAQFDPNWYASASDDKENISDHVEYEQMDLDDMEDDVVYAAHHHPLNNSSGRRNNILREEEEYEYNPGGAFHGFHHILGSSSPGHHHHRLQDAYLEDYTEGESFDPVLFPASSASSSSSSSPSENWGEYFLPSPPRAYGRPRNRPRAHDFF